MKYKMHLLLPIFLFLCSCAPQKLQTAQLIGQEKGQDKYHLTGYTDLGETSPNDSVQYINHALSDACPAGVRILSLSEEPSHNMVGNFLHWDAVVNCR